MFDWTEILGRNICSHYFWSQGIDVSQLVSQLGLCSVTSNILWSLRFESSANDCVVTRFKWWLILSLTSSKRYQRAFNQCKCASLHEQCFLHELIRDSQVLYFICLIWETFSITTAVNECACGEKGGLEKHSSAICKDVYQLQPKPQNLNLLKVSS